jgi:hypothetical protein
MKRINIDISKNDNDKNVDVNLETNLDKDKDNKNLVYSPEYSRILWTSSWLFLGTTIYTFHKQHYDLVIVPGGLLLTSINYWKHPRFNSWERSIDVYYIYTSFGYQIIRCYNAQYIMYLLLGILICAFFYKLSGISYNCNMMFLSTILHSFLHISANASILFVNSGHIDSLETHPFFRIITNNS